MEMQSGDDPTHSHSAPLPRAGRARVRCQTAPAGSFHLPHGRTIDFDTLPICEPDEVDVGSMTPHPFSMGVRDIGMGTRAAMPRLLDRLASFNQSLGRLKIKRINTGRKIWALRMSDPFHSLVYSSTPKILLLSSLIIVSSWFIFAFLFRAVSHRCHAGANTFIKALYLAIETIETIGYGVPDSTFNSCYSGLFVLGAASLWESFLNAIVISIVYTRVSRPQSRASSICFSEKAVISRLGDDNWYFMFQICDFRKHQLCEAHVRLYSLQHAETSEGVNFQTRSMRLSHPNDELGGMLLLALPQLVVHRIDPWSPLCPQESQWCEGATPANSFRFPQIPQRAADAEDGNRDSGPTVRPDPPTLESISKNLVTNMFEVLCVVEGIDPSSSSTLQARHSYTCDDIVFNAAFKKCVKRASDGTCEVDFDEFHELIDLDFGGDSRIQAMI